MQNRGQEKNHEVAHIALFLNTMAVATFCTIDISAFARYKQEYNERWSILTHNFSQETSARLQQDLANQLFNNLKMLTLTI